MRVWKRPRDASGKVKGFGVCDFEGPEAAMRAMRLLVAHVVALLSFTSYSSVCPLPGLAARPLYISYIVPIVFFCRVLRVLLTFFFAYSHPDISPLGSVVSIL